MTRINKEGIIAHLNELQKVAEPRPHEEILKEILAEVEAVDFEKRAKVDLENKLKNPGLTNEQRDKIIKELGAFRLMEKHSLIITIEEIIDLTRRKNWGICKNLDFIYLFNGAFWKSIDKEAFQKFLGEASEKMGVEKFTAKYFRFRANLFKQFLASEYFPAPQKPKDRVCINLLNGTFEITDKPHLRPFCARDFTKYQLPFAYDPEATAPKFTAFLNRVLPEKDKQAVLAECLGYIFVPHSQLKLEKALFLFGSGANGKSVLYEIIRALLGNFNTSEYTLQSLTDTNGYYRAMIADKLVNYASEINGKLDSAKFKSLASGEPLEARLPYGQPMIIEDYAKMIFNTNELPKDVEFTNAFFRRFVIIPFQVTIPENEQNKNLHKEIIEGELPGVFNWVLEGLNRLLVQKKFSDCASIDQALDQFKTESDTVKRFLEEEGYRSDPENKILLKELYPEYREFALDDGNRVLSKGNFRKRLEALNIYINRESLGVQVFISKYQEGNGRAPF
ncbi:MAG: phage/plasmid primase, P4 family [Fulvivirga sp.]